MEKPAEQPRGRQSIKAEWMRTVFPPVLIVTVIAVAALTLLLSSRGAGSESLYIVILAAAAAAVVVAAAVLIASFIFLRSVTKHIIGLTALAERISDGSYGIQTEATRRDELGGLTDSINELSEKVAQGEKLRTEFVSSVSHELRTPLTAITGWAETMAYDEAIQGDSRRGIAIISKEANRLTKMVEELLEFTRIQDGRFNLNIERLDIAAELEDIIFTYAKPLRQEGIDLVYEPCDDEIPLIDGDPERLKQVFLNIIDNAAKYGREGKKIIVSLKSDSLHIIIAIRDFGKGIPENELPHVKEKFYKGSSKERGSGIGLSVCDEIVTRHGGTLTVENATGGGVTVTVRLPVIK